MISDHNRGIKSGVEILALAHVAGQCRQYRIAEPHVSQRMRERGVSRKCISRALQTATTAVYQAENDRWKLEGGLDVDGDPLVLIVKVDAGVLVITLF